MKRQLILGFSIVWPVLLGGCGPTTEEKVQKLFQSANGWSATGEYDLAIKDYSEAIRLQPGYAAAWNGRGDVYYFKSDYDQAIKDYSEAIRLKPGYAAAWYNRGASYYDQAKFNQAARDNSEAIRLKPKHYDAWNNRGTAFKQLAIEARSRDDFLEAKEFEARARADLLKAKALKPGD